MFTWKPPEFRGVSLEKKEGKGKSKPGYGPLKARSGSPPPATVGQIEAFVNKKRGPLDQQSLSRPARGFLKKNDWVSGTDGQEKGWF